MVVQADELPERMKRTALEIFGGLASSYEKALDVATLGQERYWKRWVYDNARAGAEERILDVGCGTCLFEELVEEQGCRVVGLDLTEQMIRIGQSKRIMCIEALLVGDAESLPFSDGIFDAVVSCYVPKYVTLGKLAEETARVLRPGGRVVLYDFVRPRGPLSPILRLYIHGALRITGYFLALMGNEAAATFRKLPRIVEEARWNERIAEAFERVGVRALTCKTLSGGVVGAFLGIKGNGSAPVHQPAP
jgi:demethylmenaquinone methyltransferase/2-methoxy-6-polyprenyl-1,4-benzoquinol methylase